MAMDKRKRRPSAAKLPTKELVKELEERGYVCAHKTRVKVLGIQRAIDDESFEAFGDELLEATKSRMAQSFANKLLDDGLMRFEIKPAPWMHALVVRADMCIIVLPEKKATNADGRTTEGA